MLSLKQRLVITILYAVSVILISNGFACAQPSIFNNESTIDNPALTIGTSISSTATKTASGQENSKQIILLFTIAVFTAIGSILLMPNSKSVLDDTRQRVNHNTKMQDKKGP